MYPQHKKPKYTIWNVTTSRAYWPSKVGLCLKILTFVNSCLSVFHTAVWVKNVVWFSKKSFERKYNEQRPTTSKVWAIFYITSDSGCRLFLQDSVCVFEYFTYESVSLIKKSTTCKENSVATNSVQWHFIVRAIEGNRQPYACRLARHCGK